MKRRVVFSPEADATLDRLMAGWADEASFASAWRRFERLHQRCQMFGEFPELGRRRDDLLTGLRTFAFDRRLTIAYRVKPRWVEITAVFVRGEDFETSLRAADED